MVTIDYTMKVPKESAEVVDAVAAIIKHFVDGKPVAEAAALLPAVMVAVDGYQSISEELKSEYNDEAAGYLVHKIITALKK